MKAVFHGNDWVTAFRELTSTDFCNLHRAFSWPSTSTFGNAGNMKTALRLTLAAVVLATFSLSTAMVQAQFNYTNNGDGTATITEYTGPGGDVTIPGTINGLLVTTI